MRGRLVAGVLSALLAGCAVYEQKDPLLIYKFESFNLFKSMITRMNFEIVSFLTHAGLPMDEEARPANAPVQQRGPKVIESKASTNPGYSSPRPPAYIDPSAQQAPQSRRDRRKASK